MLNQPIKTKPLKRARGLDPIYLQKGLSVLVVSLLSVITISAQEASVQDLILEKDSIFWKAYNDCDISTMNNFLATNLEFYHDKGGIVYGSKNLNESFKNGLCKTGNNHLRRQAIKETIAVFPLKDNDKVYGAILSGEHLFYIQNPNSEKLDGQAKFNHLWLLKDGEWKMHRVLSYDHRAPEYKNLKEKISLSSAQLKKFEGNYLMESNDTINVKALEQSLELKAMGKVFNLYPDSANNFFTQERDLSFSFTEEKPCKITIYEGDNKVAEAIFTE